MSFMNFRKCEDCKFLADLLPRYNGNPKLLKFYIREVENIIQFLSKLVGADIEAIESLITWNSIKNALTFRRTAQRNPGDAGAHAVS
ncbi:unnamed protein product [Leptidea sinapis]|uniref:Uncharacterized protein n=1 Tax=Leptidea sinapis TaxID=189913 RepID=A0A5E4QLP4_9NEOP|nr:unnamed protein product [Leptidea sinapis]